ncbi:MAG: hypothetical protein ACM3ZB_05735 [bacterium]
MTGSEIIESLRNQGVTLRYRTEDETLRATFENSSLPRKALLTEYIRQHRGAILKALVPLDRRGYSHYAWIARLAHIEQERRRQAEAAAAAVASTPAPIVRTQEGLPL